MTHHMQYVESDPRHHTLKIKDMLNETMQHMREDVGKVSDPRRRRYSKRQRKCCTD